MDIFTTQLTRVVQVPIKPVNLKVKALLKEAGTSELKEDLDHLENHDYYFGEKNSSKEEDEQKENDESHKPEIEQAELTQIENKRADSKNTDSKNQGLTESEDGVKHLDLYI